MPRYSLSATILATIDIDADDEAAARAELSRFVELALEPAGEFLDGWNQVQRHNAAPTIANVSGFDLEGAAECEEIDLCRNDDCGEPLDDAGDGFDGFCGNCADRRDA